MRQVCIRLAIAFLFAATFSFYFNSDIFNSLLKYTEKPENIRLIFTKIDGGFSSQMSLSLSIAIIFLIPYFAFEILLFLKPAFSEIKSKHIIIFIIMTLLYFVGQFIALTILMPILLKFLVSFGFVGLEFYVDAAFYISFILKTLLIAGFLFQTPILLSMLINLNIIKRETLKAKRKIVFILSFVVGAVLTPPDIVSQIIVALIFYIFFESAIFFTKTKQLSEGTYSK